LIDMGDMIYVRADLMGYSHLAKKLKSR
jgi:hypothetical protein